MSVPAIFFVFMIIVGAASGVTVARNPAANSFVLPPLLWIFLAMALFELAVGYARGASIGTLITMPQRLIGLAIGVALLMGLPYLVPRLI